MGAWARAAKSGAPHITAGTELAEHAPAQIKHTADKRSVPTKTFAGERFKCWAE